MLYIFDRLLLSHKSPSSASESNFLSANILSTLWSLENVKERNELALGRLVV